MRAAGGDAGGTRGSTRCPMRDGLMLSVNHIEAENDQPRLQTVALRPFVEGLAAQRGSFVIYWRKVVYTGPLASCKRMQIPERTLMLNVDGTALISNPILSRRVQTDSKASCRSRSNSKMPSRSCKTCGSVLKTVRRCSSLWKRNLHPPRTPFRGRTTEQGGCRFCDRSQERPYQLAKCMPYARSWALGRVLLRREPGEIVASGKMRVLEVTVMKERGKCVWEVEGKSPDLLGAPVQLWERRCAPNESLEPRTPSPSVKRSFVLVDEPLLWSTMARWYRKPLFSVS